MPEDAKAKEGPLDDINAQVIKGKLDKVLEGQGQLVGRLEALEAALAEALASRESNR